MVSWFRPRTLTMLTLCLVDGYSFGNILRVFKLAGVPLDVIMQFDKYPRCSKTYLVEETLTSVAKLAQNELNVVMREIIEDVLIHKSHGPQYPKHKDYLRALEKLQRFLKLDGFDVKQQGLVRSFPEEVTREENILEGELKRPGFDLVIHHLETSFEHFGNGQWDSANGQTRKALEAVTKLIAENIANKRNEEVPHKHDTPKPSEVRKYLKRVDFLNNSEFNLLCSFYHYASVKGGHPGLSDETDARIRRIIVVGLCQFYLEKLKSFT